MRRGLVITAALLAASCGGGGGSTGAPASPATQTTTTPSPGTTTTSPPPEPGCHPSGTELEVEAEGAGPAHTVRYDTDCLAAPADTPFTIAFTNNSPGVNHNVSILSTGSGPVSTLFQGDIITGVATVTYEVDPIPAGIYRFKCSVHPSLMVGQFVVE